MMKKFLLIFALLMALTACNSANNDEPVVKYTTLVTYAGTDKDTQVTTFTFQTIDDAPLVTLTANWLPDEDVIKPGERIIIVYTADSYGVNGPIQLLQASPVIGWIPATTEDPITGNIGAQPVTYWRSGPYFNANIEAYISGNGAAVKFALLSSTKDDPYPVYYLAINQTDYNSIEASRKIAVLSFDISDVWNLQTCQGIKVIYRDYQNQEAEMTLTK
ncbi:MAG: hypothetical protein HDS64_06420 [Bacteroidales bacterium]|nr:hypothetical protein [Bacteroidales bacterium]